MASAVEDDVQLIKESSWTVCHGSLESCITVVFVDPASQEPVFPSSAHTTPERLSLVPAEESLPCEITIKFQGRLCNVQSLYILSTARTYELYSRADLTMDPEYVCTVRGWIPDRANEASSIGGSVKITSANHPENSVPEDAEDENILDETENGSARLDSGAYPSCKVKEESQITFNDNRLQDMDSLGKSKQAIIHDSVELENADLERSIYSSGEDSWVDVKFSGSFSGESLIEGSPPPQPFNRKIDGTYQRGDCLDRHSLKNNSRPILVADTVCAEMNCDSFSGGGSCMPSLCEEEKVETTQFCRAPVVQQTMYEAELELVDHCPWTSLTIRFLSLKGRSCVEIDQMVVLVVPGPPVVTSSNQSLCGGDSSALLAMLIPSMLQMVQGVPNQRFKDASHGLQLNSNISSKMPRPTIGIATSEKSERESSKSLCMSPDRNLVANLEATMKGRQDVSTSIDNVSYESITKLNTACFTSGTESTFSSTESFVKPLQPCVTVLSGREAEIMNSDKPVEQPSQLVNTVQLACRAGYSCPHSCENEKGSHASSLSLKLDTILDRFDRLEALCVRMEANFVKSVEKLDQRLTHLEKEHTTLPVYSPSEPCPLLSTPSLPVSPIPSGTNCSRAKEMDAAESSAWIGSTVYEESDTQETAVETPILNSNDINTAKGGSLGDGGDEVSEVLEIEVPASTAAIESRPYAMPEVQGSPERKPQISLDDAWNSALSAFSSLRIPADALVFTPFVDVDSKVRQEISDAMEDGQPCGSQSDVVPCADLKCTLSKEAQDLPEESSVTSMLGSDKQMGRQCLSFSRILHSSEKSNLFWCEEDSPQTGFHNHTIDMRFDRVSHSEGEQTVPHCKDWNSENPETYMIDLQGHDDDPFGSDLKLTENDNCRSPCSRGKMREISNDDAIFDLMSCCLSSIHREQETTLSGIDTLVSDMEKLYFENIGKANWNTVDPKLLNECSFVANRPINIEGKEEDFPSSLIHDILGQGNLMDLYDTACSESSTCISQEFDTFHDHFSVCEWSTPQNVCLVQELAMKDTDISKQLMDLSEIFYMNSNNSNSSFRHLKEDPIQHSFLSEAHLLDVTPQQQLTGHANFPGFEDIL